MKLFPSLPSHIVINQTLSIFHLHFLHFYISSYYLHTFFSLFFQTQKHKTKNREIFNLVDKDGGGTINKAELAELMDTLGIDASPEEIDAMIDEIDEGNNKIIISCYFYFIFILLM